MSCSQIRRLLRSALRQSKVAPRPTHRLQLHELESRVTPAVAVTIIADTLTVPEGSPAALTSSVTEATAATYDWTVTKDGGATPFATGTTADFSFTPDDNGTYDVTLVITNTDAGGTTTATDTETITAFNVAPTASISGPAVGVPGQPLPFTLGATDPSPVDVAAGFTFKIDWNNDGTVDQIVSGAPGTVVTHTYTTTGTNTVSLTATDKDDGTSLPVTASVAIKTVALMDDPLNPGKKLLAVGGTPGDDNIVINPGGNTGRLKVMIGGQKEGTFGPASRIAVYGQAGNDNIQLAGAIRIPAWLDGGEGNDRLHGAKGNDVLRGGPGDDDLNGQQGDDVLIGGEGADHILGGPGNDLMIAGTTAYDANEPALFAIVGVWGGGGTVAARVSNLRTSATVPLALGGSNPTVFDDGAADVLNGTSGGGWIFADPTQDTIAGNTKGKFLNDLDSASHPGPGGGNGGGNGNGHGNGHH
jgi:PKD repeat protein